MESSEGMQSSPVLCCPCDGGDVSMGDVSTRSASRRTRKCRSLSTSSVSCPEYRRTQWLHGPSPVTTFGPKACMLQNPQAVMHIQDPASQRLTWNTPPQSVLVVKKIRDTALLQPFKELCRFLTEVKNMLVYVEKKVLEDPSISADETFAPITKKFCTFREGGQGTLKTARQNILITEWSNSSHLNPVC